MSSSIIAYVFSTSNSPYCHKFRVSPFTGLDYWIELFSFFGQVCVNFSANLEAFFKKLLCKFMYKHSCMYTCTRAAEQGGLGGL